MIKTFESFDFVEDKLEKFVKYFKSIEYILFDDFNNISFNIKLLPILSIPSYSVSGNKLIQISMTSIIGKLSDAEIADIDIDPLTLNMPLYTSNKYRGRMMIKSKSFNDNLRSSDQYIEFIDRLENYCDENGLIFENTHTNGGFFRIFVKKTENH